MTTPEIQDYSQNGEQRHILECVPGHGQFLDIGAWNAEDKSNTRALFERGWSGVLVEPSPGPARGLIAAYGGCQYVSVVCAAVARERSLVRMQITDDALSTTEQGNYEAWESQGGYFGSCYVPTVTIKDLINQFGAFHFVNIDTEGTSVDLLHALLETPMDPQCICVEYDKRLEEAVQLGLSRGYRIVDANGTNLILAR